MKKNKTILLRTLYALIIFGALINVTGCSEISDKVEKIFGEDNSEEQDLRAKELELKEREIALKEQQAQMSAGESELTSGNGQTNFSANARVTGSAVQLRQDHSTTAQSLKSMKKNDLLQIIEEFVPDGNYGEAILIQKTDFYDEYYGNLSFSLPKGKAVMVEGRVDGDRYSISYFDIKTKQKGFAKISSNLLEFISGKAWYHVKREDGMTGWVYSEFVEKL
jgi:exonuclease III